ncbi:MAG TPA: histone H1-like repetitive region-containing protein, partial [Egicoccus sp.]
KKTGAKKTGAKKTGAKKTGAKKTGAKKTAAKKTAAKKTAAKKTAAKKTAAKTTASSEPREDLSVDPEVLQRAAEDVRRDEAAETAPAEASAVIAERLDQLAGGDES